jgi:zinc protease
LLGQLLSYGTEKLDRLAYQQALDDIGAETRAGTDFGAQSLSASFDRAVALLADNELHPALPAQALDILKAQMAQVTTARAKSPGFLAQRSLRSALFPKTDPSLRDPTAETVRSVTLDQVRAYHKAVFRPDLTTIVVVGKITPEQARATVEKYFGDWQAEGAPPNIDLPAVPDNKPAVIAVPDASRVQDTVSLAHSLTLTRTDPDYYALELGSNVLGGGFYSTRLTIHLRKEAGLVYSAGSSLQAGRTRSIYTISLACDPENVSRASAMAIQEIKNLQDKPAGEDELQRVKAMLLREIPLRKSSVGSIARSYINKIDQGLPLDEDATAAQHYIDLTPADVQAAFRKWMRPNGFVRVTQGPTPK